MEQEEQQGNNLSALAKNVPAFRQVLLLVGLMASVAVGLATADWFRDSALTTLSANVSDAEAAEIVQALQASGIDFERDERSGAILVAQESIYEARMALASAGVTRATGFGMEIIQGESGITSSQSMESARLHHALETELARSVAALRPVQNARVHLSMPDNSVFVRARRNASASVAVILLPGQALDDGLVSGIARMVAAGVRDLDASDVTVTDQYGNVRSGDGVDDDLALSERQLSYVRRIESGMESRILDLLAPVVGPENVRVSVSADVDFTVQEESREQYDPANSVVRSEVIQEERNASGTTTPSGVPGALSNTPPLVGAAANAAAAGNDTSNTGSESVRQTRNFEVDRTMSVTRRQSGTVTRLSVAVVLDDTSGASSAGNGDAAGEAADDASAAAAGQTIDDLVAEADQLVRQGVLNEARGDTLTVRAVPFYEPPPLPEIEVPSFIGSPEFFGMLWQGLSVAAILLVGFGIVRPIVRMLTAPPSEPDKAMAALPGGGAALMPAQLSYDDKVGAVRQLVDRDSERVARIVREWVGQDG